MPHIPRIEKFRGDNKQSFDAWIKLFEAQAQVLDIQADLGKQTLCLCEEKAFTVLSQYMTEHPRAVYNDVKNILRNEFCGDDLIINVRLSQNYDVLNLLEVQIYLHFALN